MLVYANQLRLHGDDSRSVVLKAIGGWLKQQLGHGLHPESTGFEWRIPRRPGGTAVAATHLQLRRWRASTLGVGC